MLFYLPTNPWFQGFEIKKMLDFILPSVLRLGETLAEKLVDLVFLGWSHNCITFPDLMKDMVFL